MKLIATLCALSILGCGDSSESPSTGGAGGAGASASTGGEGQGGDASIGGAPTGGRGEGGGGDDVCSHPRPGPMTTGVPAGVTLTPSGSIEVTEEGAVIEGLDVDGAVTVLADNVTIRNCRITSSDYYPIRYFDNDNVGLLVEDTEIAASPPATAGISFANYTARRVNVHGAADGFKADANVLIEDCWVHDLSNGPDEHNDGVQSTGGAGVTLRHNDISGASNAAVQTGDEGGATEDLMLECNWFFGGGWTLNIRGTGATVPVGTQILFNRFGRDAGYGPWTIDDPSPVIEGNVYDDNDEPIE